MYTRNVAYTTFNIPPCAITLSLALVLVPTPSPAVEILNNLPPDEAQSYAISLEECLHLTLQHNLELLESRLTPRIKKEQITAEEAQFDPSLGIEGSYDYEKRLSATGIDGATAPRSENLTLGTFLEKRFSSTGATMELKYTSTRYESNSFWLSLDHYYQSDLGISLTQPLLRNAGPQVNQAQIEIAINEHQASVAEFRQKLIQTLSECQKAYWELVYRNEELKVKELLLQQAQELLKRNREKVRIGLLAPVEILQAEAGVARRREGVIIARSEIKGAEDELKRITNLLSNPQRKHQPLRLIPQPSFSPQYPDEEESQQLALEHRPEYRQAQLELDNTRINLHLADDQTLPRLDLTGGFGLNGLGDTYGQGWDELDSGNYPNWGIGLVFTLPLGNRWARSNYMQRELEYQQAEVRLRILEQEISLEVTDAIRKIQTNLQRVQSTELASKLEEEKLRIEQERFEEGLTTSHDVLDYQADLGEAQSKHLMAVIDYSSSQLN